VVARHESGSAIVTHRDLRFETKLDAPVSSVMTARRIASSPCARERAQGNRCLAAAAQAPHRKKVLVVAGDHELKGMITVKDFQKGHGISQCLQGQRRKPCASAAGGGYDAGYLG